MRYGALLGYAMVIQPVGATMSDSNGPALDNTRLIGLLVILITNAMAASLGYVLHGATPDPVELTCEVAQEMASSPSCLSDEARIELEEENAENSTPAAQE